MIDDPESLLKIILGALWGMDAMTTLLLAALCIVTLIAAATIIGLVFYLSLVFYLRSTDADFDGTEYDEPTKPSQHPIWMDEQ